MLGNSLVRLDDSANEEFFEPEGPMADQVYKDNSEYDQKPNENNFTFHPQEQAIGFQQ